MNYDYMNDPSINLDVLLALPLVPYGNTGTYARYDARTDTYYNDAGCELRAPSEYDTDTEGYTPFGDE